jgi:hypothetical protein
MNILKTTLLLAFLPLAACDNTIAKSFGGTMTVEVASDQKLVNCLAASDWATSFADRPWPRQHPPLPFAAL